jgi:hypothetical protein
VDPEGGKTGNISISTGTVEGTKQTRGDVNISGLNVNVVGNLSVNGSAVNLNPTLPAPVPFNGVLENTPLTFIDGKSAENKTQAASLHGYLLTDDVNIDSPTLQVDTAQLLLNGSLKTSRTGYEHHELYANDTGISIKVGQIDLDGGTYSGGSGSLGTNNRVNVNNELSVGNNNNSNKPGTVYINGTASTVEGQGIVPNQDAYLEVNGDVEVGRELTVGGDVKVGGKLSEVETSETNRTINTIHLPDVGNTEDVVKITNDCASIEFKKTKETSAGVSTYAPTLKIKSGGGVDRIELEAMNAIVKGNLSVWEGDIDLGGVPSIKAVVEKVRTLEQKVAELEQKVAELESR